MKIATLAVIAASLVSLVLPSLAEAAMTRHRTTHHVMMRSHRMHVGGMGGTSGRMPGYRNF